MKVIYLTQVALPSRAAHGINVTGMCEAFGELGHDTTLVLTAINGTTVDAGRIARFYGVNETFRVHWIPRSMRKGGIYVYALRCALYCRARKPELVFARCLSAGWLCGLLGLPVVFEAHAPVAQAGRTSELIFGHYRRIRTFRMVAISHALKRYYHARYRIDPHRILVAPDAARESGPMTGHAGEIRRSRLSVGYVGHLYEGRGIDLLVGCASRCPWADFHFIGGEDASVASWRSRTGSASNVFFHGFVEPHEIDRRRHGFDVLVAPYRRFVQVAGGVGDTAQWMSPLKIFEYMATGKAIVCSDLPVLREVLENGRNAILCDPDDIGAWVQAFATLRADPAMRERLGQAAREDFLSRYTWRRRVDRIIRFVDADRDGRCGVQLRE